MFRKAELPEGVKGHLHLYKLFGRYRSLKDEYTVLKSNNIKRVYCLCPISEIQEFSPLYFESIERREFPTDLTILPIPDLGIPDNTQVFRTIVGEAVNNLINNDSILVHCAAGIGRTSIFSCGILIQLGFKVHSALKLLKSIGSYPQTFEQYEFICKFGESRSSFIFKIPYLRKILTHYSFKKINRRVK